MRRFVTPLPLPGARLSSDTATRRIIARLAPAFSARMRLQLGVTRVLVGPATAETRGPVPTEAVVIEAVVVDADVAEAAKTRRRNGASALQFSISRHPNRRINARIRVPVTKLGRLVKDGKIKSMEEIYLFSLPVKEYQIVDFFLPNLKDEVMKVRLAHNREIGKRQHAERFTDENAQNRSSPSRSRPVPVSVPASRLSSSLVTPTATSVSVSRPPRKSLPPSAPPSSLPSSTSSPSVADTGAPTLVSLTPFPSRSLASAVPSPSV